MSDLFLYRFDSSRQDLESWGSVIGFVSRLRYHFSSIQIQPQSINTSSKSNDNSRSAHEKPNYDSVLWRQSCRISAVNKANECICSADFERQSKRLTMSWRCKIRRPYSGCPGRWSRNREVSDRRNGPKTDRQYPDSGQGFQMADEVGEHVQRRQLWQETIQKNPCGKRTGIAENSRKIPARYNKMLPFTRNSDADALHISRRHTFEEDTRYKKGSVCPPELFANAVECSSVEMRLNMVRNASHDS